MDDKEKEWTLRELAAETGVPERTIRFYISRGLVDPPLRGGRGAAYGASHKARLEEVRKLQAKGLMLAEIARVVSAEQREESAPEEALLERKLVESPPAPSSALAAPEDWRAYGVAGDVIVMLRAGAAPWRMRRLLAAVREFSAIVNDDKGNDPKEG